MDWIDGAFVSPEERITSERMDEVRKLNSNFLGYAFNNLKTLRRLVGAPDVMKQPMKELVNQMEALKDEARADMLDQFNALLSRFMEQGKAAVLASKGHLNK